MSSRSRKCRFFSVVIFALASTAFGQTSGPECHKRAVGNGRCVDYNHCPSLKRFTRLMNTDEFVRRYGCGLGARGNFRVCCPKEDGGTLVTTSVEPVSVGGIPNLSGDCGRRVVGEGSEWPFLTAVGRFRNNAFDHYCNGAIISNQWVLVSSFCILKHYVSHVVPGLLLATNNQNTQYTRVIHKLNQEFTDNGTFSIGIALLKLERALPFNDYVHPVCLPNTASGGTSSILREVSLKEVFAGWEVGQCSARDRGTGRSCETGSLFTSDYKAKDPLNLCVEEFNNCNNFNPLFVKEDSNTGRFQLFGVGGMRNALWNDAANSTVYSSVANFVGWITQQLRRPPSLPSSVASQCGRRAVGDGPDYSFMVALGRVQKDQFKIACGGVLINNSWVLTEAKCVVDNVITHVRVAVDSPNVRDVPVSITIRHESFDPVSMKGNVALLKLETTLPQDDYAQSVCLPSTMDVGRYNLFSVGLRHEGFLRPLSLTKISALVDWVSKEQCEASNTLGHSYNFDTICASGGSCLYAPGLALLQRDPVTSQFTVVGIGGAGTSGCIGVQGYTRVHSYVNWIGNNLQ